MSTEQKVGCRPVRIYLVMKDGPLPRSIKQVLPLIGNETSHVYVDDINNADLVFFLNVRDIEKEYDEKKFYTYIRTSDTDTIPQLPTNCTIIDDLGVISLIETINNVRNELKPIESTTTIIVQEKEIPLRLDALSILVIDDTPKHIASAKSGLAGHKLTVVTGYEEAMKILGESMINMQTCKNTMFDVVLTDLQMPMSSKTLGPDAFKLGQLVHYGIMLMIEAAHRGVQHVAVVTDLNHHADWLSAAFDHFCYPINIDGAKVLMMHAPMKDGAKDWAQALKILMKD